MPQSQRKAIIKKKSKKKYNRNKPTKRKSTPTNKKKKINKKTSNTKLEKKKLSQEDLQKLLIKIRASLAEVAESYENNKLRKLQINNNNNNIEDMNPLDKHYRTESLYKPHEILSTGLEKMISKPIQYTEKINDIAHPNYKLKVNCPNQNRTNNLDTFF